MSRTRWAVFALAAVACILLAAPADAQKVTFKDPTGDDHGPGTYIYPTDTVYKSGSFDLTGFSLEVKGKKADVSVDLNSTLEDPWGMRTGFSVQMIFIFIDTDGTEGSGFTEGLPGTNVAFAPSSAWDRAIILAPQPQARVKTELEAKVTADMRKAVIVPTRVKGVGRTLSATIDAADLLTRKVNEYEGQHRFGGGNDADCDPHVIDLLAGDGAGAKGEIDAQHAMLAYECNEDGTAKKKAELTMVRVRK